MEFDWYGFSKMNQDNPQIDKFETIIRNSDISKNLSSVPASFRKKLLIAFQTVSTKTKNQTQTFSRQVQSRLAKKAVIVEQLSLMQKDAETSKQQLNKLKAIISQKKKLVVKLKEKIETLKKNKQIQRYFCPFCQIDEFSSKQVFSHHMFSLHGATNANMTNKSGTSNNQSTHNQLKDLLITMKDKEMQMMQMIFSQKKQQQLNELQKFYEYSRKNFLNQNRTQPLPFGQHYKYAANYNIQGSPNSRNNDLQELQGNSQYLFFQKSEQYKRQALFEEDKIKNMSNYKNAKGDPYYDIFKNISENNSESIEQIERRSKQNQNKKTSNIVEEHQSILARFSNPILSQNQFGQKLVKINPLKLNPNDQVYTQKYYSQNQNPSSTIHNPSTSITDRLKQNTTSKYYSTNKGNAKIIKNDGYIFNSGPLVQDVGGDSDYQDYFGKKKNQKNINDNEQIQDQQIKLNPGSYASQSFVSKSSADRKQISQLISPNKSDLSQKHHQTKNNQRYNSSKHPFNQQHQKSSQIVDLSDSFSKRDFQLSKDESSINLSDLKLSKLQKKRHQDQQRLKSQAISNAKSQQKIKQKSSQNNNSNNQFSKNSHFVLISENSSQEYIKNQSQENQSNKISYLNEFERKKVQHKNVEPLKPSAFSFNQKQTYNFTEYYKKPKPIHGSFQIQNQYESLQQPLKQFQKKDNQPIGAQAFFMNMNTNPSQQKILTNQMNRQQNSVYMRNSNANNFTNGINGKSSSQYDPESTSNILSRFYKKQFIQPTQNSKVIPIKANFAQSSSNSNINNQNNDEIGPLAQYIKNK